MVGYGSDMDWYVWYGKSRLVKECVIKKFSNQVFEEVCGEQEAIATRPAQTTRYESWPPIPQSSRKVPESSIWEKNEVNINLEQLWA